MRLIFSMIFLWASSMSMPDAHNHSNTLRALKSSSAYHDPAGKWAETVLNFHIEEPRVGNPTRYSEIFLNIADGTFSLVRNREDHLTTYSMDANNNPLVLLDGNEQFDEEQRARYRLFPDRVKGYRDFYRVLYGLPMSLDYTLIRKIEDMREAEFQGEDMLMIGITWFDPVVKAYWKIYLEKDTFQVRGVELTDKNNPDSGERIIFEDLVEFKGLMIPRMHHWYSISENAYLGSDIIMTSPS
ncbi:MAG: DUF6503 family protein [Cyclobacteriaceae bacterium]